MKRMTAAAVIQEAAPDGARRRGIRRIIYTSCSHAEIRGFSCAHGSAGASCVRQPPDRADPAPGYRPWWGHGDRDTAASPATAAHAERHQDPRVRRQHDRGHDLARTEWIESHSRDSAVLSVQAADARNRSLHITDDYGAERGDRESPGERRP